MNIKSELQSNNTDLQTVLDKVNALPDAGGGEGTFENCTVTFTEWGMAELLIYQSVVDGAIKTEYLQYRDLWGTPQTLSVLKGSGITAFLGDSVDWILSDNATVVREDSELFENFASSNAVYTITVLGDATVEG